MSILFRGIKLIRTNLDQVRFRYYSLSEVPDVLPEFAEGAEIYVLRDTVRVYLAEKKRVLKSARSSMFVKFPRCLRVHSDGTGFYGFGRVCGDCGFAGVESEN